MLQTLLSVPPHLAEFLHSGQGNRSWLARMRRVHSGELYVGTDPRGKRLGSGGGTVNLLHQAWLASKRRDGTKAASAKDRKRSFETWLEAGQKLVLHAGGESRRLPAYASRGKAFLPLPPLDSLQPRRFDQVLYDFQAPNYQQVLTEAGPKASVMVAAGDVWLDFNPLDLDPVSSDIVGIGMRVSAEMASHFGVFFVQKSSQAGGGKEQPISFFLQKPAPSEINKLASDYDYFVDTGMWLMSARAVELLFARCGWDAAKGAFDTSDGLPGYLDLYTEIGIALGTKAKVSPQLRSLGFRTLNTAVIPLGDARFYHLGSSRQLFESMDQLQRSSLKLSKSHRIASPSSVKSPADASLWLDGVTCSEELYLGGNNIVTGLPSGAKISSLQPEQCLEVMPVNGGRFVLRPYHIDDTLRGSASGEGSICGRSAKSWLAARGLQPSDADVFNLPLYPVLPAGRITQALVNWFFDEKPSEETGGILSSYKLLSAEQIPQQVDFKKLFEERETAHESALLAAFDQCLKQSDTRVMEQDFSAIADLCKDSAPRLRKWLLAKQLFLRGVLTQGLHRARLHMMLSEIAPRGGKKRHEQAAYQTLQEAIIASNPPSKSTPRLAIKEDQIVWSRSPVRLDLAGGWTDTPPYCLENGGAVLNVAVLLNGQPPIQVFVRPLSRPIFNLRSIDLGSEESIETYSQLGGFRDPSSGFSLAKAALCLAGFHPDFCGARNFRSLAEQLKIFGGGLEISLLSAVPKGSGLGTSSILGAALLGALNRACGLGWDEVVLYNRVLSIEQLLTTGGGWQDQAGALFRSVKLIETQPGLSQTPAVRYLPDHVLGSSRANDTLLLYYTGSTRLAKNILKEIVKDMFLARADTLRTLSGIRGNAHRLHRALQEDVPGDLHRAIARSWTLNKALDPGTSTVEIEQIITLCGEDLAACKLLGAGGGGYMFICARDPEAARRIRARLEANPPNPRSRFIDFKVAERALEVTVS
jgi:galactokinase/mevalonate kinase-like predicted kinase